MTIASHAIITKGLTNGVTSACENGSFITTHFSLFCTGKAALGDLGGGGPYPGQAWNKLNPGEIHQLYQPVPDEMQYYVVPREEEARYFTRTRRVTITVKFGDMTVEKEYVVADPRVKATVKIINMLNVTRERMVVAVSNVKKLSVKALVTISNLVLRKGK